MRDAALLVRIKLPPFDVLPLAQGIRLGRESVACHE